MSATNMIPARFRPASAAEPAPSAPSAPPPAPRHSVVADFLDRHTDLERQVHDQAAKMGEAAVEIATQRHRIMAQETELARLRIERDRFAQGFYALKAQLSAVAMAASEATRSVGNAALRALEAAKDEMRSAGLNPDPPAKIEGEPTDDGAAAMGEKYGAGFGDGDAAKSKAA